MHVSQAKRSSRNFFSLTEAKGHEMGDARATTKTMTPGRSELKGTIFCQRPRGHQVQRGMPNATYLLQAQGFLIASFKRKVQFLLLQVF